VESEKGCRIPGEIRLEWWVGCSEGLQLAKKWRTGSALCRFNKGTKNDLSTTEPDDGLKIKSYLGMTGIGSTGFSLDETLHH